MITLSNGHSFEFMTASGAMGYDGKGWPWEQPMRWLGFLDVSLFTHVIKTLTLPPKKGNLKWYNPLGCIRPMRDGAVNAVGLTNPGPDWWFEKIGRKVDRLKIALVGSIFGEMASLKIMANIMNDCDLVGLEINASCPNTDDETIFNAEKVIRACEVVKEASRHPILLKLSVVHDFKKIVKATEGIVEAFSINSVPWKIIFPNKKSPLAKLGGGGVSGKIAQPFTWAFAEKIRCMTDVPVIAPSMWDFEDIAKMRCRGFKAFSFGSIFLCHPWRPTSFVRRAHQLFGKGEL